MPRHETCNLSSGVCVWFLGFTTLKQRFSNLEQFKHLSDNDMTQSVVAEPLSSSSSTYGAVLINPSSLDTSRPFNAALANASTASLASNTTPHRPPRLTYPFPLFLAAALDVAYTTYNFNLWSGATTEDDGARTFAIILTAIRVTVLVLICGCSKRWRSRGGWVAAASGVSVGAAIWRDCVDQLTGAKMGRKAEKSVFLYTVSIVDRLCPASDYGTCRGCDR